MPCSESEARKLLAQLSLPEKLSLLEGATPFWSGMADIAWRDASHRHPWPTTPIPRLGLKGLQFVDGPRGVVLEGGATTFPVPIARGASWDVELEERIGEAMAMEARSFGADWLAAVCVNVLRHPGWGRAQETYGEDPVHLAAMGSALTRGISRHAVACVKHFALNSIDSSRFLVDVRVTPRALQEIYLPHFRACIEAGAGSVMAAYNRVNGEWCSQHRQLLDVILKQRWGFRGFVVSDFIFGVRDGVEALSAGLDLEMPFRMVFAGCLEEAVAQGRLPIERIDDAVLRQLRVQLAIPKGKYPSSLRNCRAHRELARQAASRAIVLLRNERATLPLQGIHRLALIGPPCQHSKPGRSGLLRHPSFPPERGHRARRTAHGRSPAGSAAGGWRAEGDRRSARRRLRGGGGGGGPQLAGGRRTHSPGRHRADPEDDSAAGGIAAAARLAAVETGVGTGHATDRHVHAIRLRTGRRRLRRRRPHPADP
jgi:beta-glucosidase